MKFRNCNAGPHGMGETFRNLPKDDDDDVKDNVNVIKNGLSHLI